MITTQGYKLVELQRLRGRLWFFSRQRLGGRDRSQGQGIAVPSIDLLIPPSPKENQLGKAGKGLAFHGWGSLGDLTTSHLLRKGRKRNLIYWRSRGTNQRLKTKSEGAVADGEWLQLLCAAPAVVEAFQKSRLDHLLFYITSVSVGSFPILTAQSGKRRKG